MRNNSLVLMACSAWLALGLACGDDDGQSNVDAASNGADAASQADAAPQADASSQADANPQADAPAQADAPPSRTDGTFVVTWTMIQGDNNDPATCPANSAIRVVAEPVSGGSEIPIRFPCAASGTESTNGLVPGNYNLWVELVDQNNGDAILAQAVSIDNIALAVGQDLAQSFTFSRDRAFTVVRWTLADQNGANITCEQAGATDVTIGYLFSGSTVPIDQTVPCTDSQADSVGLPLGDYMVSAGARDAAGGLLGLAQGQTLGLNFGNEFGVLSPFVITIGQPARP